MGERNLRTNTARVVLLVASTFHAKFLVVISTIAQNGYLFSLISHESINII
jgi:hypothetical protein